MKALYVIACCLFLTAFASEWVSEDHYTTAMVAIAKSIGLTEAEQTKAKALSIVEVQVGNRYCLAGLFAAGLGVAAWIVSFTRGRREGRRLTPVIPLVLCVAYVMELLKMV